MPYQEKDISLTIYRFRWVACQLDVLRDCLKPKLVRKKLKELPKSLNETYDRILLNVPRLHWDDTHRALQWLIFSQRPMTLAELAEAIAVNVDEECFDVEDRFTSPSGLLRLCASLVNLQGAGIDDNGKAIQDDLRRIEIAHYSVAEYLMSDHIHNSEAKYFAVTPQEAHEYMVQSSLLYLDHFDKTDSLHGSVYNDFPFLEYAATNWLGHLQAVLQPSDRLLESSFSFLQDASKPAYLNWRGVCKKEDIFVRDLPTPLGLDLACNSGLLQLSKLLLDNGADVNAQVGSPGNALQAAVRGDNIEIVRLLLDRGADVNIQKGDRGNALQAAVWNDNIDMVQLLLDRGADVNAHANSYGNALQVAISRKNTDMVRYLLRRGANVNIQGRHGTALQYAKTRADINMIRLLSGRDADGYVSVNI